MSESKNELCVNLFGPPTVTLDGKRVLFPLKKTEGLFYYLLLNESVPRELISSMFWQDRDEVSAANNLRNSLYMLRKIFSYDIVRSDKRNMEIKTNGFSSDYASIHTVANPLFAGYNIYAREFMEGFEILESELFTNWLRDMRKKVRDEFLEHLRDRIQICYDTHNKPELLRSLSLMLSCDISDEACLLELMEMHAEDGRLSKALQMFKDYEKRLKNELSLPPSKRAYAFYEKLLNSVPIISPSQKQNTSDVFFARDAELVEIRKLIGNNRAIGTCVNLYGEPGVGKTSLAKQLIRETEQANGLAFTAKAHDFGNKYFFSPWYEVLRELNSQCNLSEMNIDPIKLSILSATFPGTFEKPLLTPNYGMTSVFQEPSPILIGHILVEIFQNIKCDGNIVLLLEDIQWFDDMSMHLLAAFLAQVKSQITVVTTSRTKSGRPMRNEIENLSMRGETELLSIELTPFSLEESAAFLESIIDSSKFKDIHIGMIHHQTYGLPLFLTEVAKSIKGGEDIKNLHEKIHNILAWCFRDVTSEQRELLETASIFSNGTTIDDLTKMLGIDRLNLSKHLEQVVARGILQESEDENGAVKLLFRHSRLQDFFYESIPLIRRKELHRALAGLLEKSYELEKGDPFLSASLCYHFNLASMPEKELEFMLREMRTHVMLSHEQFPSLDDERLKKVKGTLSGKLETLSRLEDLKKQLFNLGRSRTTMRQYVEMESTILELQGGYMIGWGQYDEGLLAISRGMESAIANDFRNIHLNCLKHKCYHAVQTENAELLEKHGQEMLFVAREYSDELHQGMALRFIGVSMRLRGEFEKAEKALMDSIDILEKLSRTGYTYTVSVLAAWNYIGEIHHCKGDLKRALEIFEHCIETCKNTQISWGLSLFYSRAGDAAFDMGLVDLAKNYVSKSITLFEEGEGGRTGSIAYSLNAFFEAELGNYIDALHALQRSEMLCMPIKKRSWMAVHYFSEYIIKNMLERLPAASRSSGIDSLAKYLAKPLSVYKREALKICRELDISSKVRAIKGEKQK